MIIFILLIDFLSRHITGNLVKYEQDDILHANIIYIIKSW